MARILRQEIKDIILSDNQLAADFCDLIDVLMLSLPQMLKKNTKSLTHYDAVDWLSKRLSKTPDAILQFPVDNKVTEAANAKEKVTA